MNKFLFLIPLIVVFTGCTTAQFAASRMNQKYVFRTTPAEIEIFRSSSPSKKYGEIGATSACCATDSNELIEKLRRKLPKMGVTP